MAVNCWSVSNTTNFTYGTTPRAQILSEGNRSYIYCPSGVRADCIQQTRAMCAAMI